jgi:hypothetical protein
MAGRIQLDRAARRRRPAPPCEPDVAGVIPDETALLAAAEAAISGIDAALA